MKHDDEAIFWARLIDMPLEEAEQELVARRMSNVVRLDECQRSLAHAKHKRNFRGADVLGVEIFAISAQNSLIGERLRYVRILMDKLTWRRAVRECIGQEAYEQCAEWVARESVEIDQRRKEWAKKGRTA